MKFIFCTFCAFYILTFFSSFFGLFVLLYFLYCCTFWFGWTVHMNFHAKSGVCSSKNDRVMSTFVLMYFLYFCNLFGLSIQTSVQNLESVAQEIIDLYSILRFGGHFVFQKKSKFVETVHSNFHAKSCVFNQNIRSATKVSI